MTDPLFEQHVELGLLEGRGDLVLYHFHPHVVADHHLALLDRSDSADVEPHRGVELECLAAGGGLGIPKHHPDLLAQLVDEDHRAVGAVDSPGQFAEGLAHEASLETHVLVSHLALDLRLGDQRGHRVDDYQVHRAGAHQDFDDLQGLLPRVRLGHQQIVHVHA